MKFWTIQNKDVLKTIEEQGLYQPDFNCSSYIKDNEDLADLYALILQSFNRINQEQLPGVIYAFVQSDNQQIFSINSIDEFKDFVKSKQPVIGSFWKNIDKENSVIMELDYENTFNPIFVDINDFQFLMPPIMILRPYTEESIHRIIRDIQLGQITRSEFPSHVIQAHLPYIEKKNVINTYPIFDIV